MVILPQTDAYFRLYPLQSSIYYVFLGIDNFFIFRKSCIQELQYIFRERNHLF